MSLENAGPDRDLTKHHIGGPPLPETPVLTSSGLPKAANPVLSADVFTGPVSFLPDVSDHYSIFVPLHHGVHDAESFVQGRWQTMHSAAPLVHLSPMGERVGWRWDKGARIMQMRFDRTELMRFVTGEMRYVGAATRLDGVYDLNDPEICRIALLLEQTLSDPRPGQNVVFDALARMLVVHVVRSYVDAHPQTPHAPGLTTAQFAEIIDYIDRRISDTVRVVELADLAHMSESAFLRAIKGLTGDTPQDLIRHRRLEVARRLLAAGELSLGQIAIATGFADQAHLSRSFKQSYGQSPSQWRKAQVAGNPEQKSN